MPALILSEVEGPIVLVARVQNHVVRQNDLRPIAGSKKPADRFEDRQLDVAIAARRAPAASRGELAYIQSDPPEPTVKIPWLRLLPHRQTWAFAAGKFITDPVWWFLLFWLPKYFAETYDLDLTGLALPLVVIYVAADVGSIGGGWISSALVKRGRSVNVARKTAMLICALCVVPMLFAARVHNLWVTVALISLAAAAHQGWSANLYTLVSDTIPRRAVGSVVGIGGMAGAVGNMAAAAGAGYVLHLTGRNYGPLLAVCGFAYLLALLVIHLLTPRLAPAAVEAAATSGSYE